MWVIPPSDQHAQAISCRPALTGDFGRPGGGLGPRHGAQSAGLRSLSAPEKRPLRNYIANQMPDITEAVSDGRLKVLLLLGTNMLSSFADAGHVADGLDKAEMVVCVDLFMNETAPRFCGMLSCLGPRGSKSWGSRSHTRISWRSLNMKTWSRHSLLTDLTQRSTMALAAI